MPEPNPALVVAAAVRTAMAESGNGGAPPQVPKLSAEEISMSTSDLTKRAYDCLRTVNRGKGRGGKSIWYRDLFVKTYTLGRGGKGTTPYW